MRCLSRLTARVTAAASVHVGKVNADQPCSSAIAMDRERNARSICR